MRDAVQKTIVDMASEPPYWMVLLSDGADNRSSAAIHNLVHTIQSSGKNLAGFIAIAAGDGVDESTKSDLRTLVNAA